MDKGLEEFMEQQHNLLDSLHKELKDLEEKHSVLQEQSFQMGMAVAQKKADIEEAQKLLQAAQLLWNRPLSPKDPI